MNQNDITMNGITMVCQPVSISEPALFFFWPVPGKSKAKGQSPKSPKSAKSKTGGGAIFLSCVGVRNGVDC